MEFILNKIDKQWENHRSLDQNMNDLKRKLDDLNALKEDTESRMRAEVHPRKKLKKEVHLWLGNVERVNGEIQNLDQRVMESTAVLRGSYNENVLKKIQEVEDLLQQGKFDQGLVVDELTWIGQALSTTTLFGEVAESCMKEIWGYLMDDEIGKIGVWGMGGIGKTTIMKLINNQLLRETEKFDIVIWITVSKEMDIFKIQKGISRAMGQTLLEDEDETVRAGMLYEMLTQKRRYVLILDDLWDKLSLEEVGIPQPSQGSKLVVSTRKLDVCHYLDCREVKVPTLPQHEALSLFLEKVGRDILNNPDLSSIVKSVVEQCAGLPLAIVTVACSMKSVRNIHEWRNALNELKRRAQSVNNLDEKVLQQLKFSYDLLENERVKQCFLYCALWPEDCIINEDELIRFWIAEGLVEELESMQEEIDRGHTILNKLINNCLLVKDGESYVKLHDLVRDMAIDITTKGKPRFLVRAGMQLKEIPDLKEWVEDLDKVSLMQNWGMEIPPQMSPPKCHALTTLLLASCKIRSIPERFFEQMHGLKILDLSRNKIESLPNSISDLENLTTLRLASCGIKSIPECFFEQMHGLKILDLSENPIESLPNSISDLENLTTLRLASCGIKSIPERFFEQMHGLKNLDLSENPIESLPNSISDLENLNALLLQGCHSLENMPSFSKLGALGKLNLRRTRIRNLPDGMERLVKLKYLNFRGTCITKIPDGILSKFSCLQHLEGYDRFDRMKTFVRGDEIGGLRKLKIFKGRFRDVEELSNYVQALNGQTQGPREYRIFVGDGFAPYDFGKIKKCIELDNCRIYRNGAKFPSDVRQLIIRRCSFEFGEELLFSRLIPVPHPTFSALTFIEICDCKKVKKLFSLDWVSKNLQNLEVLFVFFCDEMEEIIASSASEGMDSSNTLNLALPKLRELKLWGLPELKSIYSSKGAMVCDSLQNVTISGCRKIKKLFSSDWVPKNLQNLKWLSVLNCDEMEEIIASSASELEEEGMDSSDTLNLALPKLKILHLWGLPELKSIYSAKGAMVCDSLQTVRILNCRKLTRIPLHLPLREEGRPSPPPSLQEIVMYPKESWENMKWDPPYAKSLLEPFVTFRFS